MGAILPKCCTNGDYNHVRASAPRSAKKSVSYSPCSILGLYASYANEPSGLDLGHEPTICVYLHWQDGVNVSMEEQR